MRILLIFATLTLVACKTTTKFNTFDNTPKAPDYFDPANWAALPTKTDNADRTPLDTLKDNQATAAADVFFLHPTIYIGKRRDDAPWNASIDDIALNKKVDESTILYQASVFNAAGKVYAPRYRQAHLSAYYLEDKQLQKNIFDLAYSDVKRAFEHYLKHYNKNRPIIIASHSQGTTHAKRLLKEFFENKPLQNQLVAAYLVGIEVAGDYFETLKPCNAPDETGCFVTWRTYQKERFSKLYTKGANVVVTNPLTWQTDTTYAANTLNQGAVLRKFDVIFPQLTDAQIHDGWLWITKPKFPGSFLWRNPNYHIADYNLFYLNVRSNAVQRVEAFLEQRGESRE